MYSRGISWGFVFVNVCLMTIMLTSAFMLGRLHERLHVNPDAAQAVAVNRLIAVGFVVLDPEGEEVDHFDEE